MGSFPQFVLPSTEVRKLYSSFVGEDYQVFISLPFGYDESKDRYPVLYVLDGDRFFPLAWDIIHSLEFQEEIPELILVGIGYGKLPNEDGNHRSRDLTPTVVETEPQPTGGADLFFKFFQDELIPFVDKNYRTKPSDRSIWGQSLGGLFVLNCLFRDNRPFFRHLATSASPTWDDRWIIRREESFAKSHSNLDAKLFLTEDNATPICIDAWRDFSQTLRKRDYDRFDFDCKLYENEGHSSCRPSALTEGLRFLFKDSPKKTPEWVRIFKETH